MTDKAKEAVNLLPKKKFIQVWDTNKETGVPYITIEDEQGRGHAINIAELIAPLFLSWNPATEDVRMKKTDSKHIDLLNMVIVSKPVEPVVVPIDAKAQKKQDRLLAAKLKARKEATLQPL